MPKAKYFFAINEGGRLQLVPESECWRLQEYKILSIDSEAPVEVPSEFSDTVVFGNWWQGLSSEKGIPVGVKNVRAEPSISTFTLTIDGVRLLVVPEDGDFINEFLRVWAKVPSGARETILRYWKKHSGRILPLPILSLCNLSVDEVGIGAVNVKGFVVRFASGAVDRQTDEAIRDALISHEIAHVHFWAEEPERAERTNSQDHEAEAEKRQRLWNFKVLRVDGDSYRVVD